MRSGNWFSLVCRLIINVCVIYSVFSSVAYADSRYIVSQGDTLSGIAEIHHTSVTAVMKVNQLHTTLLQIHQSLRLPGPSRFIAVKTHNHVVVHTVHSGDTLWTLAIKNHTSVESITEVNHLTSSMIHPGQKLAIHQYAHVTGYSPLHEINLRAVSEKGIPLQLIPVYQAAGQKYGVPWTVLAAIHRRETNFSTTSIVSYAGAEGPMQFMPSTFQAFGVTAPGHYGAPDIDNVYDAIYTAAHMLSVVGYARNPAAAIYLYNHSISYVESVQRLAESYRV